MQNINPLQKFLAAAAQLHNDESGATATEYIVLLVLVACFVIAIVKVYGKTVSSKFASADQLIVKEVRF